MGERNAEWPPMLAGLVAIVYGAVGRDSSFAHGFADRDAVYQSRGERFGALGADFERSVSISIS